MISGDLGPAEDAVQDSLALFERLGDRRGQGWALQHLAWVAFARGDTARSRELLDRATVAFEELGNRTGVMWCKGLLAWVVMIAGDRAAGSEMAAEVLAAAEDGVDPWGEAMMLTGLASATLWEGRTSKGVALARRATEVFERLGEPFGRMAARAIFARGLAMSGEVDEALTMLARAAREARDGSRLHVVARHVIESMIGKAMTSKERRRVPQESNAGVYPTAPDMAMAAALSDLFKGDQTAATDVLQPLVEDLSTVSGGIAAVAAMSVAMATPPEDPAVFVTAAFESRGVTYHDRVMALLATVLWRWRTHSDVDALAAAREAQAIAGATEDLLLQAVVSVFVVHALDTAGATNTEDKARRDERWKALGVLPTGWIALTKRATAETA